MKILSIRALQRGFSSTLLEDLPIGITCRGKVIAVIDAPDGNMADEKERNVHHGEKRTVTGGFDMCKKHDTFKRSCGCT